MKKGIAILTSKAHKLKHMHRLFEQTDDSFSFAKLEDLNQFEFDFFLQHSIKKPTRLNNDVYDIVQSFNKPILIREAAPIRELESKTDRTTFVGQWMRLSWNSYYFDDGIFPYDSGFDRWGYLSKKYNLIVEDWQRRGDNILFNLQILNDSALNRLSYAGIDYCEYCIDVINKIKLFSDRKIIVRPHPRDTVVYKYLQTRFPDIEFSFGPSLKDDLNKSWCMITYNSTTCVESILYGVPTITLDSSAAARDVSGKDVSDIEKDLYFDRSNWLKKIAFLQWSGAELSDGYVWSLLKSLIWPQK